MYNCEVLETLKHAEYRFLHEAGHKKILKVRTRQNGLTAYGKSYRCHHNCNNMMYWKGGSVLRGYTLEKQKKGYRLDFHSIWITPEGKGVCITRYDDEKHPEYRLFIPIYETKLDSEFWILPDIDIKKVSASAKKGHRTYLSAQNLGTKKWELVEEPSRNIQTISTSRLMALANKLKINTRISDKSMRSSEMIKNSLDSGGFYPPNQNSWNKGKEFIRSTYLIG